MGRAAKNYPRELKVRAMAMVREVRPDYPSEYVAPVSRLQASLAAFTHCAAGVKGLHVGARDWMLLYADGEIRPILQAAPDLERDATHALVTRLYPGHRIYPLEDGTLLEQADPPDHHVYAACYPGLAIVCTPDVALDRPSQLHRRFLHEAAGRLLYLHAMHSVVSWFAYAFWTRDGMLQRALSVSPASGIIENLGAPRDFEVPFWAGAHPVKAQGSYSLPFHPLELGEEALRALFGFNYEGFIRDDDPDLENIVLAGFTVHPIQG